jgi:hypothetical protein
MLTSFSDIFSVNVWCGIIGNRLIGPHFFQGTLTGAKYLAFLRKVLPGLLEDVPLNVRRHLIFQQDGAPAHNSLIVRRYLERAFPGRHMTTHGQIKWPARSPDLSPLDFYLWGFLKQSVYHERSHTIDELQQKIRAACNLISPQTFALATSSEFLKRMTACSQAGGQHFEHLL